MALTDDLEYRRQEADRHRENSARLAQAVAVFVSTGQGTTQYAKRINFGLTFIEKPVITYGSQVDMDDLEDLIGTDTESDADDTPLPVCTGFVTQWDRDERGFYTGCWIAARVYYPDTDYVSGDVMPVIEHHFMFSAVAIKDIPTEMDA